MAKRSISVTPKQKAAAALSVKRSATTGRFVTRATKAIANAQPNGRTASSKTK